MSHITFNSYASKIYENHPLAVWGLDDNVHYLSSVSAEGRIFDNWTAIDCTMTTIGSVPEGLPHAFNGAGRTAHITPGASATEFTVAMLGKAIWKKALGTEPSTNVWSEIKANYPDNWDQLFHDESSIFIGLNSIKKSLCTSFFVYSELQTIEKYVITIKYKNSVSSKLDSQTVEVPFGYPHTWEKVLGTFDIQEIYRGFTISITVKLKVGEAFSGSETIHIGGFNVGQWSEVFCHTFDGQFGEYLPAEIGIYGTMYDDDIAYDADIPYDGDIIDGIRLASYFDTESTGYVLIAQNRLLAVHDGLPIVYGSVNTTCLDYPAQTGMPSIVIPAHGFLTKDGRYNETTLEFWLRLENFDVNEFRIVGPLETTDGLYVEEGFLTLKIGGQFASYYMGKWYRPMLIGIRYSMSKASLLINGEEVITLNLIDSDISSFGTKNWIGFYCQQKTFPMELDCIAIYPYYQNKEIAKKNFVYGQGVQKTNIVDQSFLGDTVQFDFPYSKYTVDFKYPSTSNWKAGIYSNLVVSDKSISIPTYKLPSPIFTTDEISNWESDMYALNASATAVSSVYMTFKDRQGFLHYPVYNQLNEQTRLIVASIEGGEGPVMTFKNEATNSYLQFNIRDGVLDIQLSNNGGAPQVIYSHRYIGSSLENVDVDLDMLMDGDDLTNSYVDVNAYGNVLNIDFSSNGNLENIYSENFALTAYRTDIAIDIEKFIQFYGRRLQGFFSSPSAIALYIGGYGSTSFTGKIYGIGFNNSFYTDTYFKQVQKNGFFMAVNPKEFISNYQLLPHIENGRFTLDIGISGYWKSAVPLSFFAKYVKNSNNESFFDLDVLQLNVNTVVPGLKPKSDSPDNTYQNITNITSELNVAYSWLTHTGITYADTYESYEFKEIDYTVEPGSDFSIKPFVTFQHIENGIYDLEHFVNTEAVGVNRVLDTSKYAWESTRFFFVDGTIVYPPKTFNFTNMLMCFHIKFDLRKSLKRAIELNNLEACSLAFDNDSFYNIGTKFGTQVYPIAKSGVAYMPKAYNPFVITKESSGYLYLTGDSGIELLPDTTSYERGIYIPINKTKAPNFQLGAIRLWLRYGYDYFPTVPIKLFEINAKNATYHAYIAPDVDRTRVRLFLLDMKHGAEAAKVKFIQEDAEVFRPFLTSQRWTSLTFVLGQKIDMSNEEGSLILMPGATYQNIGIFEASNEAIQNLSLRSLWREFESGNWSNVLVENSNNRDWAEVYTQIHESSFFVDGVAVYKSLIGTESVMCSDNDPFAVNQSNILLYQDIVFKNYVLRQGEPLYAD